MVALYFKDALTKKKKTLGRHVQVLCMRPNGNVHFGSKLPVYM